MLIRATATFHVEGYRSTGIEIAEGTFADLNLADAEAAIRQGAARAATMDEVLAEKAQSQNHVASHEESETEVELAEPTTRSGRRHKSNAH